mgnify:CR=1 FL=1
MGCDYFIIRRLRIEHSDGTDIIELDKERCYFPEYIHRTSDIDSDDTDYDEKVNSKYDEFLKVTYKPRILFENCAWKNKKIETINIRWIFQMLIISIT